MEGIRHRKRDKEDYNVSFETGLKRNVAPSAALPNWLSFIFFGIFLLFLHAVVQCNQRLPVMLKAEDEKKYPDRFIGERAKSSLLKLATLGPKLTGSYECEVSAVQALREEIADIAQTTRPIHLLQEDLQHPKGSFPVPLRPHGFNSIYENIQNFAVKIGPRPPSKHSILVNCHFDTVPDSPGASDNGLNCAVMIEILRKISRQAQPLQHNIIFLFNGAEEQFLQGAHGFITGHDWHQEVRVVVNLDSAGAGGREFLFQVTPDHPWLLELYAESAPHPSATLAGQEVFEAGMIPSDTDYRIFRDFGPVPGYDFAHGDNGYIYHTRLDTMDYIADGVFQHTGDNILALLLRLSAAPQLANLSAAHRPGDSLVYFDLFDTVMLVYSRSTAAIVNVVVFILIILSAYRGLSGLHRDSNVSVFSASARVLVSCVCGAVSIVAVAVLLDSAGAALSWYARPYYILPLYVFPYVAAVLLAWTSFQKVSGFDAALQFYLGGQTVTGLLLLLLTVAGVRSSYLIMVVLLPPAIVAQVTPFIKSVKTRLVLLTGASLVGLFVFFFSTISFYFLLIPISARSGSTKNPELLIGGITILMAFIAGNSLLPVLLTVRKPQTVGKYFALLHLAALFLIILTPLGFPYSGKPQSPALQRFYIYHTQQTQWAQDGTLLHNSSGVFLLPMDRNWMKYVTAAVPALGEAAPVRCDDPERLLCLFPLYNGRYVDPAKTSVRLPFPPPTIQYPTTILLEQDEMIGTLQRQLKFRMKGPDHMTLVLSPRGNVTLKDWTLGHIPHTTHFAGRQYYVVFFSDGLFGDTSHFQITLETDKKVSGPWIDVSLVGHYQHQKATYIPEFADLINEFPDWTQATAWIAAVDAHAF